MTAKASMTREQIIAAIRECAEKLGRNPRVADLEKMKGITLRRVSSRFSTFKEALRAAGVEPVGMGYAADSQALLKDWGEIARKLGKLPTLSEYGLNSKHSSGPFFRHFGGWRNVPDAFWRFAEGSRTQQQWADVLEMIAGQQRRPTWPGQTGRTPDKELLPRPRLLKGRPVYGPPVAPNGWAHEPINEAGVLFLFARLADRLGFVVTSLQAGFPDCEALREVQPGRWQRVLIEFEFYSRNFLNHGHNKDGCDMIVCWVHNWPECPASLEVVELKTVLARMGQMK